MVKIARGTTGQADEVTDSPFCIAGTPLDDSSRVSWDIMHIAGAPVAGNGINPNTGYWGQPDWDATPTGMVTVPIAATPGVYILSYRPGESCGPGGYHYSIREFEFEVVDTLSSSSSGSGTSSSGSGESSSSGTSSSGTSSSGTSSSSSGTSSSTSSSDTSSSSGTSSGESSSSSGTSSSSSGTSSSSTSSSGTSSSSSGTSSSSQSSKSSSSSTSSDSSDSSDSSGDSSGSSGESSGSGESSSSGGPCPCDGPAPDVLDVSSHSVEVAYPEDEDMENVLEAQLQIKWEDQWTTVTESSIPPGILLPGGPTERFWLVSGLAPDTQYRIRFLFVCRAGGGPCTSDVTVFTTDEMSSSSSSSSSSACPCSGPKPEVTRQGPCELGVPLPTSGMKNVSGDPELQILWNKVWTPVNESSTPKGTLIKDPKGGWYWSVKGLMPLTTYFFIFVYHCTSGGSCKSNVGKGATTKPCNCGAPNSCGGGCC